MQAVVVDLMSRFEVTPEPGDRAPLRVKLSLRPCWRKPPVRLELEYVYERDHVAYYRIVERH